MAPDDPPRRKEYPLSPAKLSKTPSWIMLGFILGAAFVAALPKKPVPAAPPPERPTLRAIPVAAGPRPPPRLTTIEAVFELWGRFAVWSDDTTEVALWNAADKAFTEFYEVRRSGTTYYFRTIPALTRRILTHGIPVSAAPLQFTETEQQYREWFEYGRTERPPVAPDELTPNRIVPSAPERPKMERIIPPLEPAPGK
jgi:hypothetical protein